VFERGFREERKVDVARIYPPESLQVRIDMQFIDFYVITSPDKITPNKLRVNLSENFYSDRWR